MCDGIVEDLQLFDNDIIVRTGVCGLDDMIGKVPNNEFADSATFMVASDPHLQGFVEELTKVNRGRAYFASPDNLGEFLLADYIRNRRRRVH